MRMLSPSEIDGMPETSSGAATAAAAARAARSAEKIATRHILFIGAFHRGRCGAVSEGFIGGDPGSVVSARRSGESRRRATDPIVS